jgi:hypothetical protein
VTVDVPIPLGKGDGTMNYVLAAVLGAGMVLASQLYLNDLHDRMTPARLGGVKPATSLTREIMPGVSWAVAHSREYPVVVQAPTEAPEIAWETSVARVVYAGMGRVRHAVSRVVKYVARHARLVWDAPIVRHRRRWFHLAAKPYARMRLEQVFDVIHHEVARHTPEYVLARAILVS